MPLTRRRGVYRGVYARILERRDNLRVHGRNKAVESAVARQKIAMVGVIKKLSLNLVEKWRRIRESNDYAMKFYRPKLIGSY